MLIYMTYKLPSGDWQSLSAWESIEEVTNFFIGFEPKEYKISFAPEDAPAILKAIRLAKDIKQTELAEKIGVAKGRLFEYEKGERFSLDILKKLGESLNQKVLITLEGTSDFTKELAPPKDLTDELELVDFEAPQKRGRMFRTKTDTKKLCIIEKYINGQLDTIIEALDLIDAKETLESLADSVQDYTWIYAKDFNEKELGLEVPEWFVGDGVYNQNHELVFEKGDLSLSYDNWVYKIREENGNN